jgi:Transposase
MIGPRTITTSSCRTQRGDGQGPARGGHRRYRPAALELAEHLEEDAGPEQVAVGIETDRGPWVVALVSAGYRIHAINPAINPLQVARYRERTSVSGAKSDAADAHTLAEMVRTDGHQLRTVAGDSPVSEAVKVITRAHKRLTRKRTRALLRDVGDGVEADGQA